VKNIDLKKCATLAVYSFEVTLNIHSVEFGMKFKMNGLLIDYYLSYEGIFKK